MSRDASLSDFAAADSDEDDETGEATATAVETDADGGATDAGGEAGATDAGATEGVAAGEAAMDATGADDESADDVAAPAERDSDADGGAPSNDSPAEIDDVEPAQATYAWAPDGAACERCAKTATARWRDEDDLVCADCKDW